MMWALMLCVHQQDRYLARALNHLFGIRRSIEMKAGKEAMRGERAEREGKIITIATGGIGRGTEADTCTEIEIGMESGTGIK
jgi:hypothetical protein